jgi:hypothetical protein
MRWSPVPPIFNLSRLVGFAEHRANLLRKCNKTDDIVSTAEGIFSVVSIVLWCHMTKV